MIKILRTPGEHNCLREAMLHRRQQDNHGRLYEPPTPRNILLTLLLMQLDTLIELYKFPCAWSQITPCRASVAVGSWDTARQGQDPVGRMVPPRSYRGGSGLQEGLWVSREVRCVGLSQGPGATFPEMSQAPTALGFPEQRLDVDSSTWREQGALSPGAVGTRGAWQSAQGDGYVIRGNWTFL